MSLFPLTQSIPDVWNNISRSVNKNSVYMHKQCQRLENHKALHGVCFLWVSWQGSVSEVIAEVSGNFRDKVTYINICRIAPALQKPTEWTIFKIRYHINHKKTFFLIWFETDLSFRGSHIYLTVIWTSTNLSLIYNSYILQIMEVNNDRLNSVTLV